jgi:hypothetical protein
MHRKRFSHAAVMKPGEDEHSSDLHFGIELTEAQVVAASSGTEWLWVYGCVHYAEFLGKKREYRFCWRFANRNVESVLYYFASDGDPPRRTYSQNDDRSGSDSIYLNAPPTLETRRSAPTGVRLPQYLIASDPHSHPATIPTIHFPRSVHWPAQFLDTSVSMRFIVAEAVRRPSSS